MFPIPFNMPYRKPDGTLTTIGDVIASGGGGGGEVDGVYLGETDPDNAIGEDSDFYLKFKKIYPMTALVPTLTGASDKVLVSNQWTGDGDAWKAFDENTNTYWSTQLNYNTNQYIGYDFGDDKKVVTKVGINPRRWSNNNQIKDFKIQASNDGESWVDLLTDTIPNTAQVAGVMNYYEFDNATEYRYYRLFVLNANSSQTITIFEVQFYAVDYSVEPNNIEVVNTFKKVDGEWLNSLMGYKFKTHSTGGSDASIDVFLNIFGTFEFYGTYYYNGDLYSDENVSLTYSNNWKLTPLKTLYDANGDEVSEQTWAYNTSEEFVWYIDDPT